MPEITENIGNNGQKAAKKKRTVPALKSLFLAELPSHRWNVTRTSEKIGVHRNCVYAWCKKDSRFADQLEHSREAMKDHGEEALVRLMDKDDTAAIIFFCKTMLKGRGYVEPARIPAGNQVQPIVVEILDKLITGDLDVTEAAFRIERVGAPLPESIRILLSKQEPEAPDDGGDYISIWDEEQLERDAKKYRKAMAAIDKQFDDFVPQRRSEVQKMKAELSGQDSFSDENLNEKRRKNERRNREEKLREICF